MESSTTVIGLLGGLAIGAAVVWFLLRGAAVRLRADLQAAQAAERTSADEVAVMRRESETWRCKFESEQLETEARRVAGLDAELQQIRGRTEALAIEKSALQIEAGRVPGLEARVSALGNDTTELKATNAQLQTQLQEQTLAHAEKIAVLTEVRGEIEKDLKNITADALRANQGTFLELANEVFEKHKAGAAADLEARQKAVQSLVVPLQETLQTYKQQVDEMEKARSPILWLAVCRAQGCGRGADRRPHRDVEARQCLTRGAKDARSLG